MNPFQVIFNKRENRGPMLHGVLGIEDGTHCPHAKSTDCSIMSPEDQNHPIYKLQSGSSFLDFTD